MAIVGVLLAWWFVEFWLALSRWLARVVKPNINNIIKILFNWRFLILYLLSWAIIHVPILALIVFGSVFDIRWMRNIGLSIYGFFWLPFCNESIVQCLMALYFQKKFFPNNTELEGEIKKQFKQ